MKNIFENSSGCYLGVTPMSRLDALPADPPLCT